MDAEKKEAVVWVKPDLENPTPVGPLTIDVVPASITYVNQKF